MSKPLYTYGTAKLKTPFVSSVRHAWMLGTVPLCTVASVHCSNAAGLAVVRPHDYWATLHSSPCRVLHL